MRTSLIRDLYLMPLAFLGLIFPRLAKSHLGEADFADSLAQNEQLRQATPERREQTGKDIVQLQPERLRSLRSVQLKSSLGMASAVGAAVLCQSAQTGFETSPRTLAISSLFCFAWATLGRLGWETYKGTSSVERLDSWIFRVLYWVGLYLGTLSLL
jgi:hypothetical protein